MQGVGFGGRARPAAQRTTEGTKPGGGVFPAAATLSGKPSSWGSPGCGLRQMFAVSLQNAAACGPWPSCAATTASKTAATFVAVSMLGWKK